MGDKKIQLLVNAKDLYLPDEEGEARHLLDRLDAPIWIAVGRG